MKLPNILAGILLIVSVIIMSISGCKKFEEDPELIHLRTVKKRIEGLKEMSSHTMGGVDLMPYWKERFGDFYLEFTLDDYDPHHNYGYKIFVYDKQTDIKKCEGIWWFFSSTEIEFHFDCLDADTSTFWPNYMHGVSGEIIRLSNDEMWLRNQGNVPAISSNEITNETRFVEYKK